MAGGIDSMQLTNVAIVGAGKVGALHAQALRQQPGARVVAVCDPVADRAQSLAVACNAEVRTLDDALADPAINAVILATPSDLHAAQARQCVSAGKHTLCEFPLFDAPLRLRRCFELAQRQGVHLMAAHTTHYMPVYIEAKRILTEGRLGAVRTVVYRRRLHRPGGVAPDRNWRDNALTHLGGHALDVLTWLTGDPPLRLRAFTRPSPDQATQAGLLIRTAGGALAHINIDFESLPNDIWLEIGCAHGTMAARGFSRLEVNGRLEWQATDDETAYHAAIATQDEEFINLSRGGSSRTTSADTLRLNIWMARAMRSARQQ